MAISSVNDGTGYKQDERGFTDGEFGSAASEARDAGKSALDSAKHAVKDGYEGIRESAGNAAASLKDVIVHNPMTSLAVAAAAGMLIGLVVCTRRS